MANINGAIARFALKEGDLAKGMLEFAERFDKAMNMFLDNASLKLKNHAQTRRRWTDRTNQARLTLNATWEKVDTGYRVTLAHGVDYGIHLELKHQRKYEILMPTIQQVGYLEIVPAFSGFIEKMKAGA